MNAPRRWLETEEASSDALELLRAGQPSRRMDGAVRRRSRQRLAGLAMLPAAGALAAWPQLALGALVGTAGTVAVMSVLAAVASQPTPTSSSGATRPNTSKIAGATSTGAAGPAQRPAQAGPAGLDSSDDATPPPAGSTRGPFVGTKPVASEAPGPTPPVEGLQQEIELLEQARRKLASDPAQAERLLIAHERRFAGGQLRIERELLLIDTLVRLGRRSEAEALAWVLERHAPTSLYGQRLHQIVGGSGSNKKTHD